MRCPHCNVGINLEIDYTDTWIKKDYDQTKMGYDIAYGHCPVCEELIVLLRNGIAKSAEDFDGTSLKEIMQEEVIYPRFITRKVEPEVPERYQKDFKEACAVLPLSPKASAALSRRILQDILREKFSIKHPSLDQEIKDFIKLKDIPTYLAQAVDAVRNIGNFAAHPLKDTNTGEVIDVEPGEADWLLEVIEALFDFAFVQPIKLEEKKQALNRKLQSAGKPAMKG